MSGGVFDQGRDMQGAESEPQRQQRLAGQIKDRILAHLATELNTLADGGTLPAGWFAPIDISRVLEKRGYWLSHPEPLAGFLSLHECERLTAAALAALAVELPKLWWRHDERYRSAASTDWNALARDTANRLRRELPNEQPTAVYAGPDEPSVIFGPSSATADSRQPVALLRDHLRAAAIPELGFSMDDDREAWVMLVWSKDERSLQQLLLAAWRSAVAHG